VFSHTHTHHHLARDPLRVPRSLLTADRGIGAVSLNGTRVSSRDGTDVELWPELEALSGVGSVRRRGAYEIRRIENPARTLNAERVAALHHMCARASSLSFGVDHSTYWASRPDYFSEISEWWIAERTRDLAGWHAIAVWNGDCGTVLYHDRLVLLPAHRRTGLGALLIHEAWLRVGGAHQVSADRRVPDPEPNRSSNVRPVHDERLSARRRLR
jgi:GNAT superfamily N-acetyltransferase